MNNFEKNETQCLYGERRTPSDNVVVEECPECGSEVRLKRDEKTGEWTRETGDKMNVNWIRGEIKPLEEGKYYVITEVQKDTTLYKKGDIVIDYDWYSKALGWMSIRDNGSTWKILAWAEILLPDVPEEVKDRLVTYFDTEVKNRRNK